ncbi:hypothetical protein [Gloeothece citriformis]|uniref:hypothetical protein n=1 Tax=Gloeothece citriformis TaxID=2546356 RepID=UPI000173DB1A|nr:hypothetical protein [Gloeothece citriformis]
MAISGFYKQLNFISIGLIQEKVVIFDHTVYFLPCYSENEAKFISELLNSQEAKLFFSWMIFWSDKRPITINLLKRLNLQSLAKELGRENEYFFYLDERVKQLQSLK